MSYLEERLQADLTGIRDFVWNLGEDVEQAVRDAKRVLLLRDEVLAYQTVLGDNPINRASRKCDRLCHAFIARHLPSAGHLREMAGTIRVNVALERIGDYAVTICREAMQLEEDLPGHFQLQLDEMSDECVDILRQSREAFRDQNAELAMALMKVAKRVEGKMDNIYGPLFDEGASLSARTMLVVFVVFSLLKRVTDQAKNICDQTVYTVRGVAKIPKVHRILFLDQQAAGRGLMAAAIGRKNHGGSAEFLIATPGATDQASGELLNFLDSNGLESEGLVSDTTEALVHDWGDFDVIISVNGSVYDYLEQLPFHTSAQRWDIDAALDGNHHEMFRELRARIDELMDLLVGDEVARADQ
jgi:phosphate transport system protein